MFRKGTVYNLLILIILTAVGFLWSVNISDQLLCFIFNTHHTVIIPGIKLGGLCMGRVAPPFIGDASLT